MTDQFQDDDRRQALTEYLKGALANRHIINTGHRIDCEDCHQATVSHSGLVLDAPKVAIVCTDCVLRLRINNLNQLQSSGTLHIGGTGTTRHRDYEFTAPFQFNPGEKALCMAFQWQAPDYPTHIEWAVTLHYKGRMGMSISRIAETAVVKELRSSIE